MMAKEKRYPFAYFVETNQGLSFARNRGIKESKGQYVAFVDDDAIMRKDYFQNVIDFIDKTTKPIAFGGIINVHFEGNPPKWENKYINSMFGFFRPSESAFKFSRNDYPRGSNMIFHRQIFTDVGDFNTKLGRVKRGLAGNEEKDLFHRIYDKNIDVYYDPELVVDHIAPVERTEISFVKRQAQGTGNSERIRTQSSGTIAYLKAILKETFKWGATLLLFVLYVLKGQPSKGNILIRFRYWISSGLLGFAKVS